MTTLPPHLSEHIKPEPNTGCWLWSGALTTNGYGSVYGTPYGFKQRARAHRVVYKLLRGDIEAGRELDHLCRVRCCVNPDHLEPVTRAENIRRSPLVGRWPRLVCPHGHPKTPENSYFKKRYDKQIRCCLVCLRAESKRRWQVKKGTKRG